MLSLSLSKAHFLSLSLSLSLSLRRTFSLSLSLSLFHYPSSLSVQIGSRIQLVSATTTAAAADFGLSVLIWRKYTEINLLLWDWKNNKLKVFWILQNLCLGNKFLWISKFVRIKCRRKKVLLTKIYLVWFTSLMLTKHSVWIKFIKLIKILIIFRKRFAVESFTYKSRLFGTICTNHLKTIKVYEA